MTDFLRTILFATAHWCGGSLGGAIFIVSFVLRLLMLPLARAVHREAGYRPFTVAGLLGILVQWPLMAALFGAVRKGLGARVGFLWVTDLARPDRWLITTAAMLAAGGSAMLVPAGSPRGTAEAMVVLSGVMTFVFLWFASSAIAISYGAGSLVSMLQGWLIRQEAGEATIAGARH
jgi:membrane protein insertase Oxa1/YidC/SpoIIIJ